MGTTDTALEQDAGVEIAFVIAIEGYENLIVSRDTAKAVTAWAGTDWAAAIDGLSVRGAIEQSYKPFGDPISSSRLNFVVDGQGGDTIGEAVFNRSTDAMTELRTELSETATTIEVLDTNRFDPSPGVFYIGTERISYAGKTHETFFGCTRGMYSPFKADTEAGQRFAQLHRIETDDLGVVVPPEVTQKPRHWAGRRVGLWVHRIVGGVWDTRDEARLDFAGRIIEVTDDPTGATVILAEDLRAEISKAMLGVGKWRAVPSPKVWINAGTIVKARDVSTVPVSNENSLTFVASSPGASEVLEGYFDAEQLASILNGWFGALYDASLTPVRRTLSSTRRQFKVSYELDSGSSHGTATVILALSSTGSVFESLGFAKTSTDEDEDGFAFRMESGSGDRSEVVHAVTQAWALDLRPELRAGNLRLIRQIDVKRRSGSWYNNAATAPEPWRSLYSDVSNWGFVRIGKFLGPAEFVDETTIRIMFRGELSGLMVENLSTAPEANPVEYDENGQIFVEQVICLQGSFANILRQIVQSVNGNQYNDATWDNFPRQLAAPIPGELVGSRFDESLIHIDASVGAQTVTIVIDKPVSLLDVFGADLMIRQAFFVFEDGELQLSTFASGIAALAHHTFDESTKMAPAGQTGDSRIPIRMSTEFLVNNVKLAHSRQSINSNDYADTVELRDQPSIDAFGSSRPVTIKLRNSYVGERTTSDMVEVFAGEVAEKILPLFGRPIPEIEIPISFNQFHAVPGDTCSVTDSHARNPDDGKRGIVAMCGTILSLSHSWYPHWSGKARVLLFDRDRFASYAPAARIDSSENSGGFSAGYDSGSGALRMLSNEYSGAIQGEDAGNFEQGDLIRVIEVDPDDPSNPQYWDVAVDDQYDDDVVVDAALTGWDAAKQYRIISQRYNTTQSEQRIHAYLASRDDLLIEDSKRANEFSLYQSPPRQRARSGANTGSAWLPASSADDLRENIPVSSLREGAPATPALESALARLCNHALETVTAPQMTQCNEGGFTNIPLTITSVGWHVYEVRPFYVGVARMGRRPGEYRPIVLAPFLFSTSGNEAQLRVRSCLQLPIGGGSTALDVEFPNPVSPAVTFTSTATAAEVPTAQKINPVVRADGMTFLVIEARHENGVFDTNFKGWSELRVGEPEALP